MSHLWGRIDNVWHALFRHDPEFQMEEVESVKLTAAARAKNPKADAVVYRRVIPGSKDGPGHGNTACGLMRQPLAEVGVDPESGDMLCPGCVKKIEG